MRTALLLLCFSVILQSSESAELVSGKKIWDRGAHNAFTDLTRQGNQFYCVFREGKGHVSPDGAIRVLRSGDGEIWESAALIQSPGFDLRDPKISITPENRLMILGGATVREGNKPATESQSFVSFSETGTEWSRLQWAGPANFWLWRVTWHQGQAYGVAYDVTPGARAAGQFGTKLLKSTDGSRYETVVSGLFNESGPTEATLRFATDGTAYCLQRRDGSPSNTAVLGTSKPPYRDWQWKDLGKYFGGPDFIQVDGRWIAGGRLFNVGTPPGTRTALCELNVERAELTPLLILPSAGDSSYPGLVWHDGFVWMSYYSSHEGKTSIHLAKIKL